MFQVMSKAALTAKELTTTIVGAEGMMNSRAFNYQSSNTGDPEPLTPKHFLINQVGGQFAPESVPWITSHTIPEFGRDMSRKFFTSFGRCLREWPPSLSPRKKWAKEKRALEVSDMVLVLSTDRR